MKVSELAKKKVGIIAGGSDFSNEHKFISIYIYSLFPNLNLKQGVSIKYFLPICDLCHYYGGRVIGVETVFEEGIVFFTTCWEEYSEYYTPEWVSDVVAEMQLKSINNHIIIHMDIPEYILDKYLKE